MKDGIDIPLVLDKIRPKAVWRMADTYDNLKATWDDSAQTLPTESEIEAAWKEIQSPRVPTKSEELAELDAEYQPQRGELLQYINVAANILQDQDMLTELRAEWAQLEADYQIVREGIEND